MLVEYNEEQEYRFEDLEKIRQKALDIAYKIYERMQEKEIEDYNFENKFVWHKVHGYMFVTWQQCEKRVYGMEGPVMFFQGIGINSRLCEYRDDSFLSYDAMEEWRIPIESFKSDVECGDFKEITKDVFMKFAKQQTDMLYEELSDWVERQQEKEEDVQDKSQPTYEMVDLGLPSGLKWAAYNIGASKPEEYGDYFMWGSTTPNNENECDWAHAPFNNGASFYNEAYFNAHKSEWLENDVLKPEYDAATVLWGAGYRMPTKEEFDELLANTTNVWTTENGVNGRRFTSKTDTTKSIFIPASGYRSGSSSDHQGSYGYVWSSSLNSDFTDLGFYLYFDSNCCVMSTLSRRYHGFCVRPVSDK